MKNVLTGALFLKALFICLLLSNFDALAQNTTIWLVRHAEKSATDTSKTDPTLSNVGQRRAEALAKELKREDIKAIFVTPLKRTGLTTRPLAVRKKILPRVYTGDPKPFAAAVVRNFKGKKVLVVGHSNTVMQLLDAFGVETPFPQLDEGDYDMLFKVTISDNGKKDLEITNYGDKNHVNSIPEKYLPEINHPEYVRPFTNY